MRDMDVKLVTEVGKLIPTDNSNRNVETKEVTTRRTKK